MRPLCIVMTLLLSATAATSTSADSPPPIPSEAPVLLLGAVDLRTDSLRDHHATLAMGRAGKDGPMTFGQKIAPGALQESILERVDTPDGSVLRRTTRVRRPGNDQVLAEATIEMDPATLKPLSAKMIQAGQERTVEYDWETFTIRRSPGAGGEESDEIALDLPMLEVGAHDVWMAALPLSDGYSARLPAVFAATGTKYWAVPRVVASEAIDLGDGRSRDAWVVELNWWGMGADNTAENFSPGGGANGSGGTGGKYWVLKSPIAGTPSVVRVRTEIDAESDSVIQLQGDA